MKDLLFAILSMKRNSLFLKLSQLLLNGLQRTSLFLIPVNLGVALLLPNGRSHQVQDGTIFNPLSYEAQLSGLPDVIAAMVIGTDRLRAALIVQMNIPQALSDSTRSGAAERLWPMISQLNSSCPVAAIIFKSNIILTEPEKPLPRTSKGTLKRGAASALYADNLDHLYSRVTA